MIVGALAVLGAAVGLVLFALEDAIVFFYTPSEVAEKKVSPGQRFRLGGLVAEGTVVRGQGTVVSFSVTDTDKTLPVKSTRPIGGTTKWYKESMTFA